MKDYCMWGRLEGSIGHVIYKCALDMYGCDGSKNYMKLKTSVYTTLHV